MRVVTEGAKEMFMDRIQCGRDVVAALDFQIDNIISARHGCCDQYMEILGFDLAIELEDASTFGTGHYTFIGIDANGARVYAMDGSTVALNESGLLTGSGFAVLRDPVMSTNTWTVGSSPDWFNLSMDIPVVYDGGPVSATPATMVRVVDATGWQSYGDPIANLEFSNITYET